MRCRGVRLKVPTVHHLEVNEGLQRSTETIHLCLIHPVLSIVFRGQQGSQRLVKMA
jgi:hypothetical protein